MAETIFRRPESPVLPRLRVGGRAFRPSELYGELIIMRRLVTIKPVVRPRTATALVAGAALVWVAGGSLTDARTSAEAALSLSPAVSATPAIQLVANETVLPTATPRIVPTWRDGGSDGADGSSGSDNESSNCVDNSCNVNVNVGGRQSSSGGGSTPDDWDRHHGGSGWHGPDWDHDKDIKFAGWWKKLFGGDGGGHRDHHDGDWDGDHHRDHHDKDWWDGDRHWDKHDHDINININGSHDDSDDSDDEDGSPKGHDGGSSGGGTSQASAASEGSGIDAAVQALMATIQAAVQQFVSAVMPGS
jgi:hypothetical protein